MTAQAFWDKKAEGYAAQAVSNPADYEIKLDLTRKYLRADMDVLEVGCGTGSTSIAHAPYVKTIDAYDVSGKMVDIAAAKALAAGIDNLVFRRSDLESLDVGVARYDAILALNILHLLKNRRDALAKLRTALKPGGVLISSTPCLMEKLWYLLPVIPIARLVGAAPYVSFLSARALREEIAELGFEAAHEWVANKGNVLFLVSKKSERI